MTHPRNGANELSISIILLKKKEMKNQENSQNLKEKGYIFIYEVEI